MNFFELAVSEFNDFRALGDFICDFKNIGNLAIELSLMVDDLRLQVHPQINYYQVIQYKYQSTKSLFTLY